MGAKIGDFPIWSAYDLSDHEAVSGLEEASNNHSSPIMWKKLWKARVPNKIVFHGLLFGLSYLCGLAQTPKVWQLLEGINFIPH